MICRSLSTEHGPAIATTSVRPRRRRGQPHNTILGFPLPAHLFVRLVTWMTSWTPGRPSSREATTRPSLPPGDGVRCAPGMAGPCSPSPRSRDDARTSSSSRRGASRSALLASDGEPVAVAGCGHPGPRPALRGPKSYGDRSASRRLSGLGVPGQLARLLRVRWMSIAISLGASTRHERARPRWPAGQPRSMAECSLPKEWLWTSISTPEQAGEHGPGRPRPDSSS